MSIPLDPPSKYHKYLIYLGPTVGSITIDFDTNPVPPSTNTSAIPVAFRVTWNSIAYPPGALRFYGDPSFDTELVSEGYPATYSSTQTGGVTFNKTLASPEYAQLEVFTPLNNSIANFIVICPTPTPTPTLTPTPTPTPTPTLTPTPTSEPCIFGSGESCPDPGTGSCGPCDCVEKVTLSCKTEDPCDCLIVSREWIKCQDCPVPPTLCSTSMIYCTGPAIACCDDTCQAAGPNSLGFMCPENKECCDSPFSENTKCVNKGEDCCDPAIIGSLFGELWAYQPTGECDYCQCGSYDYPDDLPYDAKDEASCRSWAAGEGYPCPP